MADAADFKKPPAASIGQGSKGPDELQDLVALAINNDNSIVENSVALAAGQAW